MKVNKKKSGDGVSKSPANKVQEKPNLKKGSQKNAKGNHKQGTGQRNQFTFAEEKRLDKIRLQNERKADKEAKILLAKKDKKRKLRIFAKKNNRGQPLMKGRMELLLEKIEKRVANN